jgi:hypothetical protein
VDVGEQEGRGGLGLRAAQEQRSLLDVARWGRRLRLRRDDEHREAEHEAHERAGRDAFQQQSAEASPFAPEAAAVRPLSTRCHCRRLFSYAVR